MKDDAASEVVGVILIVAITVVVAAVVAAFAFGMDNSIKKPHAVYFTVDRNNYNNDITITNIGGADLALLRDPVTISYTDSTGTQTTFDTPANIIASSGGLASGDLSKLSSNSAYIRSFDGKTRWTMSHCCSRYFYRWHAAGINAE